MLRVSLAALLTASILPVAGAARVDARPGRPLLTYVPRSGGLCLARADGTHRTHLTLRWIVDSPAWSPGGRYVGFTRRVGAASSMAFADARGRVRWVVSGGPGVGVAGPAWAPDGRHIAYYKGSTSRPYWYQLVVARPTGAQEVVIGGNMVGPGDAGGAAWAPDGQSLAFEGVDHQAGAVPSIFSVPVGGGDWRLLIGSAENPAYSPDGSKLAYVSLDERFHSDSRGIYVADADGGNPRLVAAGPAAYWPAWSPDGRYIAFERLDTVDGRGWQIVVANADGSGERVAASGLLFPQGPSAVFAWSPGARLLAFYRGDRALLVVSPDGTNRRVVARHVRQFTDTQRPAWRPPVALPTAKRRRC